VSEDAPQQDAEIDIESEIPIEELAQTEVNKLLSPEDKVHLYTDMVRIRAFEARSLRAYQQGKMGGFLHLYEGQEAVAVGCVSLMGPDDHMITAYRDHGHALAVGMTMNECMAELFGKATGCSKGKGGSMHFFAPDKNYWGGHGIVGGQVPLGTGLAYALKYQEKKGSCMTFMGDGAVNQGAVHEAFNLAGLWDLPVIFIIENNKYSMGTSQERSSAFEGYLAKRAEGYGMAWEVVNGNNIYDVREKTYHAIKRAHNESKPTILEMFTYRYRGHSVADANAEKYRDKAEIQDYKKFRDPITLFQHVLINEGHLSEDKAKMIEKDARAEADKAADFADKSPFPAPESILEDTYWSVDHKGENEEIDQLNQGRIFFEKGTINDNS